MCVSYKWHNKGGLYSSKYVLSFMRNKRTINSLHLALQHPIRMWPPTSSSPWELFFRQALSYSVEYPILFKLSPYIKEYVNIHQGRGSMREGEREKVQNIGRGVTSILALQFGRALIGEARAPLPLWRACQVFSDVSVYQHQCLITTEGCSPIKYKVGQADIPAKVMQSYGRH